VTSQDSSSPNSVALVLREVSTAGADMIASSREPGSRIGRYILDGPMEDAGVGALYAAHDSKLERRVALRLIPSSHEDGTPYSRARLLRETRSMARLSHSNVIQIYDVGATRRELFIAMELLDGESVRTWIDRASPAWSDVLATFVDAGRGLVAAHEAGLVHGDFDSRYVQRTETGRVVVTDFGLTRARTRGEGLSNVGSETQLVRDDQYAFCTASTPVQLRSALLELDAQLAQANGDVESARSLYASAESVLADEGDAEHFFLQPPPRCAGDHSKSALGTTPRRCNTSAEHSETEPNSSVSLTPSSPRPSQKSLALGLAKMSLSAPETRLRRRPPSSRRPILRNTRPCFAPAVASHFCWA